MPVINVDPLVLRDVVMTIAGNDHQASCSEVTFVPNAPTASWKGLTPASVFSSVGLATWQANITYVQDWQTANSLAQYLMDNEGQTVTATFKPRSGSGPSFTAQLIITPGSIGGKVDEYGETSVSLGCNGRPVRNSGVAVIATVTALAPATAGVAGGQLIKVTGTSFTGATAVTIGGTAAPQFRVESDTTLYVVAPANAAGAKPVVVTNPVGPSTVNQSVTYS